MNLLITSLFYIKSGVNQNDASTYTIVKLYFEQANEQPNALPNTQAIEQANEHIITKLNLLFNYIYKNQDGQEIGLLNNDKEALIERLKKLDLFTNNPESYNLMPEYKVEEQKIMIWAIKEIYKSPYDVYLVKLKREDLVLRFNKAKKYMAIRPDGESFEERHSIKEFINYFIVCLQEELKKGRS